MNKADETTKEKANKVDHETATLEVNKFLDLKHVPKENRTGEGDNAGNVKALVKLVEAGSLKFNFEKKRATYKLLTTIKPKTTPEITEVSMRFFMGAKQAFSIFNNIAVDDVHARSLALVAGLSGNNPDIFKAAENADGEDGMDLSDHNKLINYTIFFLA